MDIDEVEIHLNGTAQVLLQMVLAFVMFGIALDTDFADFKEALKKPKPIFVGVVAQLLLFPAATCVLILCLNQFEATALGGSMAFGLLLVAACPGGNISNFLTYLFKGNVALSVILSAISTLVASIFVPFNFAFWSQFIPDTNDLLYEVSLSFAELFKSISFSLALPMFAGLLFCRYFPLLAHKMKKPVNILSRIFFTGLLTGAILTNWTNFINYIGEVLLIVALHNCLGLAIGWIWAKLNFLSTRDCRTIAMEVGIQNSGLGLILALQYFPHLGGMAFIAAWWGIWHVISGGSLMLIWRAMDEKEQEISQQNS